MLIIITLLSLLLFKNSFSIYFFQDDWFLLSISKVKSLSDFLHFFIPRSDVQFYRPLSGEIFYLIGEALFGFNPLSFHLIVWMFFILNIFLVYKLAQKFIHKKSLQFFLVFLYATSAIHYNSLYWLANFSYILSGFWYFLGFLVFLNKDNSIRNKFWLMVIYILGLLSNEFMITFPMMILIYTLLFDSTRSKKYFSVYLVLFAITLVYLWIRLFIFKPNYGTYRFIFDKSLLSSSRWFLLFFLNWPETMKDQMLNWYKVNSTFLLTFWREFYIFVLNLIIFATTFVFLPIINLCINRKYISSILTNYKRLIFGILWFIINLLPIIFIPSHISPHQGTLAIFGFLLLFISLIDVNLPKAYFKPLALLILFLSISWIISSYTAISLNDRIHWIKRRADLARYWIDKTFVLNPTLSQNQILYLPTEDKEVKVALDDGQAFKEIYKNDSVKVIFKAVP